MFALLQVFDQVGSEYDDEWTANGVNVIKVDTDKERLEKFAAAYQYRYRAACEDFDDLADVLDEANGGEWGPRCRNGPCTERAVKVAVPR
jgi:hypothetical protein